MLPLGFSDTVILLMALPQIEQEAKRHQPRFIHAQVKLGDAVIQQSSKQLIVAYSVSPLSAAAAPKVTV